MATVPSPNDPMSIAAKPARTLPFDLAFVQQLTEKYPTPFYIYDESAIRENARRLIRAFSWCTEFKEFFAVKATPNPHILKILHEEGFGGDCSSLMELLLCQSVGVVGQEVMFTSNNTPANEFQAAYDLGAVINLDDLTHVEYLAERVGVPETICFRYNPGPLREGNAIIGQPEEAKYGFTKEQLLAGYRRAKELGVQHFGLHTMVASNERNIEFFGETAEMLFTLCAEVLQQTGIRVEYVNLGGGIGIPYRPEEEAVDLEALGQVIKRHYDAIVTPAGLDPLAIYMENGRMVTGPFGYLVTRAIHSKETYKNYIGVDACMANLMRPGMYGAYHHISVLGKESRPADQRYDVVGSLCENNDKFAIDRELPAIEIGDFLAIHDAGAHGHAMGFQYNGKLRSAELLLQQDGTIRQIRRAETASDYFATLDYPGLNESAHSTEL
jgi:diaminopimelate decarboxylase